MKTITYCQWLDITRERHYAVKCCCVKGRWESHWLFFGEKREWYDFRAGHWWKRLSLFWERSPVSYPPHACLLMFCLALLPGLDSETMPSTCEESLITFTFSQGTVAFCDNRDLKQRMWQRVLDSWCTLIFVSHCVLQETCHSNPELWWWFFFLIF